MKVEIWSDVVCPWCYIGKRRFEAALARFEHSVEVVWRSFELDSSAPAELPESLEWAEFRASAQANRVHETRNFDALHWRRAIGGRAGALETTCNEVGFRPE